MLEGRGAAELEAICFTVKGADLEDTFLLISDLPSQVFEICVLAVADHDFVLCKVCCYVSNGAAVAPGIEAVGSSAHILDGKFSGRVGIDSVVVTLALVKGGDGSIVVVAEENCCASGGAAVTQEEAALDLAARLVGLVLEPLVWPGSFLLLGAGRGVGKGAIVQVPQPGAPRLARSEVVTRYSLEMSAVNHVQLNGIASLRFAVDLESSALHLKVVESKGETYHKLLLQVITINVILSRVQIPTAHLLTIHTMKVQILDR